MCVLPSALGATGCATQRYEWGRYEESIAELYKIGDPAGAAQKQLPELLELVERADVSGRCVPPGVLAHIGYLYAASGDGRGARRFFLEERRRYPESAVLMDRFLARLSP